jgi:tripartite-type tricarboxylate transporter receptor subunit TctC
MLRRRTFLKLGAAVIAASTRSAIATPAPYPVRPVYLIVGFSAGGNTDIVARLIGEWLTRQMSQPFIIENRTGAATNIATEQVVHAPADGYTLLVSSTSNAIKRHPLSEPEVQLHSRYRADRSHHDHPASDVRQPVLSGALGS